jgi:hypothetical protein
MDTAALRDSPLQKNRCTSFLAKRSVNADLVFVYPYPSLVTLQFRLNRIADALPLATQALPAFPPKALEMLLCETRRHRCEANRARRHGFAAKSDSGTLY